jgi:heme/copper-type cytochrome/quinol oxidase subunit 2
MKKRLGLGLIIVGVLIALPASSILLSLIAAAFSEYGWSRGIAWYWVIVYVLPTPVSLAMIYFGWRLSKQKTETTSVPEEAANQVPTSATKTLAVIGIFIGSSTSLGSFSTFILIGIDPMYAVWSVVSLVAGAGIIWLSLRSLKGGRK